MKDKKLKEIIEYELYINSCNSSSASKFFFITKDYAKEISIDFFQWVNENCYEVFNSKTYYIRDDKLYDQNYTIRELYSIYEEKIYYSKNK